MATLYAMHRQPTLLSLSLVLTLVITVLLHFFWIFIQYCFEARKLPKYCGLFATFDWELCLSKHSWNCLEAYRHNHLTSLGSNTFTFIVSNSGTHCETALRLLQIVDFQALLELF